MTHYPKCKSCSLSRECAIPKLVALESKRQEVPFGGVDYRYAEFEIAGIIGGIKKDEQHQEPCPVDTIAPGEIRPEDV